MNKTRWIAPFVSAAILLNIQSALPRDIDLDSIYIKNSSPYFQKLFELKLEAYQKVDSQLIDRDVVFADWTNGFEILYIKEVKSINIAFLYNRKSRASLELFRFTGTPTIMKMAYGGRYCLIKRILVEESGLPTGDGFCYDIISKSKWQLPGTYPFLDFTLSPSGGSLLHENLSGITEIDISTKQSGVLIQKEMYADIISPGSPSMVFLSPNRKNMVVLGGSGGNYSARIFYANKTWSFNDIGSISEFFWISNHAFVYRKGVPGNFSVNVYEMKTRSSSIIMGDSFHTSINFSSNAKMISFLKDQVIHCYSLRENKIINTGIEGDDVSFSPDGNRFVSLLRHRLFMSDIAKTIKKQQELNSVNRSLADLYRNLQSMKSSWENEYTPVYIKRKLALYK